MLFRFHAVLFTVLAGMASLLMSCAGGVPESAVSANADAPVKRATVIARSLPDGRRYFLYVPRSLGEGPDILVTVHGISRNAEHHVRAFAPVAERYGVVIVAPYFESGRFSDYQRLGRSGHGERADLALRAFVEDAGRLTGAATARLYLFGHSGGAQFVHRYAMAHPDEVIRYVASAAGWYTLPDPKLAYPYGIRPSGQLPGVGFAPDRFLRIPAAVLVGARDTRRDLSLNRSARIDARQGTNRTERARRWISAMTAAARRRGLHTPFALHVLPGSGHEFTEMVKRGHLVPVVADFLFGDAKTAAEAAPPARR